MPDSEGKTREGPATEAVVRNSRLAGDNSPEARLEQSRSGAPIGTTTTGAVPGGILDPNNKTIVRDSPEGDGPARDERNTAARDQELATDGSREAEAEHGAGADASEADSDEPDRAKARARRDRSLTPDAVRAKIEEIVGPGQASRRPVSDELKLTRLGHFHAGNGEEGRCYAALVVGVHEDAKDGPTVDLQVYAAGLYDVIQGAGTAPGATAHLSDVVVDAPAKSGHTSFHLSRACPWAR